MSQHKMVIAPRKAKACHDSGEGGMHPWRLEPITGNIGPAIHIEDQIGAVTHIQGLEQITERQYRLP